jgi:3-dehydroquinate synthase
MTRPAIQTVDVPLGERAYQIHIGGGLLARAAEWVAPVLRGREIFLAVDANAMEPHGRTLAEALRPLGRVEIAIIPPGEESKCVAQLDALWDRLSGARFGRNAAVVAVGGGVTGDLVGFAAASYLRGVDFIQVPTTLLAMVDSSVGGKTGINNRHGKNLLGAFWQPRLVLADTDTLATLPMGERIAALAEIIKYGVIYDAELFRWLEANIAALRDLQPAAIAHAVRRSCAIKADVVTQDERESGLRQILNFGHTVGHAIENVAGYGTLRHGEAIAVGMIVESALGLGHGPAWTTAEHQRLVALIAAAGLPTMLPAGLDLTLPQLFAAASSDKKNRGTGTKYIVPRALGTVEAVTIADDVVAPLLLAAGAKP